MRCSTVELRQQNTTNPQIFAGKKGHCTKFFPGVSRVKIPRQAKLSNLSTKICPGADGKLFSSDPNPGGGVFEQEAGRENLVAELVGTLEVLGFLGVIAFFQGRKDVGRDIVDRAG